MKLISLFFVIGLYFMRLYFLRGKKRFETALVVNSVLFGKNNVVRIFFRFRSKPEIE